VRQSEAILEMRDLNFKRFFGQKAELKPDNIVHAKHVLL